MPTTTPFRVCDRCKIDTDDELHPVIEMFTGCATCGPIWLCQVCASHHRRILAKAAV